MNDKKEFATIKIYKPTAKRLKSFIKSNGNTIAGWVSPLIDSEITFERQANKLMKEAKKEELNNRIAQQYKSKKKA